MCLQSQSAPVAFAFLLLPSNFPVFPSLLNIDIKVQHVCSIQRLFTNSSHCFLDTFRKSATRSLLEAGTRDAEESQEAHSKQRHTQHTPRKKKMGCGGSKQVDDPAENKGNGQAPQKQDQRQKQGEPVRNDQKEAVNGSSNGAAVAAGGAGTGARSASSKKEAGGDRRASSKPANGENSKSADRRRSGVAGGAEEGKPKSGARNADENEDQSNGYDNGGVPKVEEMDKDVLEAFQVLERKKTGFIDTQDLREVLPTFNERLSQEQIEVLVAEADPKNEGKVDVNAFNRIVSENYLLGSEDPVEPMSAEVQEIYDILDPEGRGFVETLEVLELLPSVVDRSQLSDDDMDVLIGEADCDGIGRIKKSRFVHMINQMPLMV